MRKIFCFGALLLVSSSAPVLLATPAAQESKGTTDSPRTRLRADIQRAIQNGTPTESELATLQKALATLRQARADREQGRAVDRQQVLSAFSAAEKVFQSNSFQAADREAVQRDLQDLRNQRGK